MLINLGRRDRPGHATLCIVKLTPEPFREVKQSSGLPKLAQTATNDKRIIGQFSTLDRRPVRQEMSSLLQNQASQHPPGPPNLVGRSFVPPFIGMIDNNAPLPKAVAGGMSVFIYIQQQD